MQNILTRLKKAVGIIPSTERAMPLALHYLAELKKISAARNIHDFKYTHGASPEDMERLRQAYPDTPQSLLDLLSELDGAYYRKYGYRKICLHVFGGITPYYLNSVAQILNNNIKYSIADLYEEECLDEVVGPGIDPHQPLGRMLHFSDCTNNGGSSQLYIDFNPAQEGRKGQIVRFVHDPDEYTVIASDFDAFLRDNLKSDFDFVIEEEERSVDPGYDALVEDLRAGKAGAVEFLAGNLARFRILDIAYDAPTPDVLRIYLNEMLRLYGIRHESYAYEARRGDFIESFKKIFQEDAALRHDVADFACKTNDAVLLGMCGSEANMEDIKKLLKVNFQQRVVTDLYTELSPEDFYKITETTWTNDAFFKWFHVIHFRYEAGHPRTRQTIFSPLWRERFLGCRELGLSAFAILCDLGGGEEHLDKLKAYCVRPEGEETMDRLAFFAHAACLAGEGAVDKHLDFIFSEVLQVLRNDSAYFDKWFNPDPFLLEYALRELKEETEAVSNFTFIISLRPEKSLAVLQNIESMLTPKGKAACAQLGFVNQ
jgi:hypothetical protein